jgi:hypothetical protein
LFRRPHQKWWGFSLLAICADLAAEADNDWPNTIIDYQVVTMAKHYQVLLPAQIILKCAQQIG